MLALLLACRPDGTAPSPTTPASTPTLSASCAPDPANALRATCSVTRSPAGPASIALHADELDVVFTDDAVAEVHTVPIWGLVAATTWSWTASADAATAAGSFDTPALPPEVAFDPGLTSYGPTAAEMVLLPASCGIEGVLTAIDLAGRVRWYQDLRWAGAPPDARLMAAQLGDDDTLVAVVDQRDLVRVDLAGTELLRLTPDRPVHHDVTRRNGVTWTFLADAHLEADGVTYVEDQVVGFDDDGEVVSVWDEHDHLDATQSPPGGGGGFWAEDFPGAVDAWHSNGLFVADSGDLLVSLHRADTVLRVSAGGDVVWRLVGDGSGDFALTGDARFAGQHDPALLDEQHVTVFDNSGPRGLELELSGSTGTAVGQWPIQGDCSVQGSIFPLPDDHWLVTCAEAHRLAEYDGAGALVTTFAPRCPSGSLPLTVRGQPVDLWDARVGAVRAARPR